MSSTKFRLTQTVYNDIVAHARAGKPQEVCGILRGRENRAFEAVRGRNTASDPIRDYELDPQTLLRQFEFEKAGDEMVAIYHSHPATTAYPSASDAWSAHYPDAVYLICSLEKDDAPIVRAYRMTPHDLALDLDIDGLDIDRLRDTLELDETRPGRFAYYQPRDAPLPSALPPEAAQIPAPFYIVFQIAPETGKIAAPRVVSIVESQIEIVPDP